MKRALIVRHSSIGDVIHTLPALDALHRGGWEVGWVVEPGGRQLLETHPLLGQLVSAPPAKRWRAGEVLAAIRALRGQSYDVALDFGGLWKSAAWARLSGASRVVGFSRAWRREPLSRLLLSSQHDLPRGLPHVIDKNLALLSTLGIDAVGSRAFPLPPTEAQAAAVERGLSRLRVERLAVLCPGGGWRSKLWPARAYGELALGLRDRGLDPLVTWGPGEEALADEVVVASRGAAARAFPTGLLELAELARRAEVVIAADTGPLHLACAVGAPVVGLFGPTDPARNGPFASRDLAVRRTPSCAPCYKQRCETHAGIMDQIPPAEVLEAIGRRLEVGREDGTVAG